jgi:hypothetical protein
MSTEALVQECSRVAEDSLYTAQAHFETARLANLRERWGMLIIPSSVAAISSILVAVGPSDWKWLSAIAAAASLVATVAGYLRVDERVASQTQAGNAFTTLRHEARLLAELADSIDPAELRERVTRITERYASLVQTTPLTDNKGFDIARKRIKQALFVPDK